MGEVEKGEVQKGIGGQTLMEKNKGTKVWYAQKEYVNVNYKMYHPIYEKEY